MSTADALKRVLDIILVDCYGEDEEYGAFHTVLDEEIGLPIAASLLGTPVTVTSSTIATRRVGWSHAATVPTAPVTSPRPTWPFPPPRWPPGCTPPTATILGSNRSRQPPDPTGPGPTETGWRSSRPRF
jgi:hypothetical protein